MSIATGLTALRMLAIEAASIVAARKDGDNLILTTYGGDDINVGNVKGDPGVPGPQGISVPIGGIIEWPGDTAPANWLMLTPNATFAATEYPALAALIGTKFGGTAANPMLPPRSGRVGVGVSSADTEFNTLGKLSGEKAHALTASENGQHTHVQDAHSHTQNPHNHTQDAHNHAQDAHNHSQNPHGHTDSGHTHTQDGHYHAPGGGTSWVFVAGAKGTATKQSFASSGSSNYTVRAPTTDGMDWPYYTDTQQPYIYPASANIGATTATNQATTAKNQAATATNQAATATNQAATATNQDSGTGAAHNNIQPSIAMNYIIRAA